MFDNRRTFERADVVRFYGNAGELQAAETTIFDRWSARLPAARLLDIGIGGGRTTAALAPRVRAYVGVDYAAAMVDACRARFAGAPWLGAADLRVADARDLAAFDDASFDVVLFSYNGIDYVDLAGRAKVLAECRRVLCPGGDFALSSHNTKNLPLLFALAPTWNPIAFAERVVKHVRLRRNNPPVADLAARPHALVRDGSYNFRSETCYLAPRAQIAELESAGFGGVAAFRPSTGEELDGAALDGATDPWIYYAATAA